MILQPLNTLLGQKRRPLQVGVANPPQPTMQVNGQNVPANLPVRYGNTTTQSSLPRPVQQPAQQPFDKYALFPPERLKQLQQLNRGEASPYAPVKHFFDPLFERYHMIRRLF